MTSNWWQPRARHRLARSIASYDAATPAYAEIYSQLDPSRYIDLLGREIDPGFSRYVVFGFPQKNLYVVESMVYGNATYMFARDWESLSRMTKAEILEGGLHEQRLVHRLGWEDEVRRLLR